MQELQEQYPSIQIKIYVCDLANSHHASCCISQILSSVKTIDVLFNAAGIAIGKTMEIKPEDLVEQMNVNFIATSIFSTEIAKKMKQQESGYIFTMSSIVAKKALASDGGYCASKAAVLNFSQALFYELLEYNVKVTALCPGAVETDMTNKVTLLPEEKIQTDDIVKTVDFLLSLSPSAVIDSIDIRCAKRPF